MVSAGNGGSSRVLTPGDTWLHSLNLFPVQFSPAPKPTSPPHVSSPCSSILPEPKKSSKKSSTPGYHTSDGYHSTRTLGGRRHRRNTGKHAPLGADPKDGRRLSRQPASWRGAFGSLDEDLEDLLLRHRLSHGSAAQSAVAAAAAAAVVEKATASLDGHLTAGNRLAAEATLTSAIGTSSSDSSECGSFHAASAVQRVKQLCANQAVAEAAWQAVRPNALPSTDAALCIEDHLSPHPASPPELVTPESQVPNGNAAAAIQDGGGCNNAAETRTPAGSVLPPVHAASASLGQDLGEGEQGVEEKGKVEEGEVVEVSGAHSDLTGRSSEPPTTSAESPDPAAGSDLSSLTNPSVASGSSEPSGEPSEPRESGAPALPPPPLRFITAVATATHPARTCRGSEDAYLLEGIWLGVADGISSWADQGEGDRGARYSTGHR